MSTGRNKKVYKNRIFTIILAVLFGSLGLHEFYLDRPRRGILLLIFAWTGIPLIIGILQGIKYYKEGEKRFQRKVDRIHEDKRQK